NTQGNSSRQELPPPIDFTPIDCPLEVGPQHVRVRFPPRSWARTPNPISDSEPDPFISNRLSHAMAFSDANIHVCQQKQNLRRTGERLSNHTRATSGTLDGTKKANLRSRYRWGVRFPQTKSARPRLKCQKAKVIAAT